MFIGLWAASLLSATEGREGAPDVWPAEGGTWPSMSFVLFWLLVKDEEQGMMMEDGGWGRMMGDLPQKQKPRRLQRRLEEGKRRMNWDQEMKR